MIYINRKNWNLILGYAQVAYDTLKSEIGGMSVCVKNKDGDWEIQDPVILKQEVSGGNCTLEQDALAKYYTRTAKMMKDKEFRFCWWHSHHTMKAFWSSTDLEAIEEFNDGDFSFALVVNLKEEYKLRVSVWNPVEAHEDVELQIVGEDRSSDKIKKDIKAMCSKESTNYGVGRTYSWNNPIQGPHYVPKSNNSINYYKLRELIDDEINKLVKGDNTYKDYKKRMKEVQKVLSDNKSQYSIKILTNKEVKDEVPMYLLPDDYILDPQTKLPFNESLDDGIIAYNQGWI